ncbi:helix-turn-helix domain-containing protein [Candidatus Vondammii sp. HM_W22]|uniref:helix-turn-helix domain-containing protein n=1 Tax=Candidatus Vondammii sp. HM_W22 TaxID=2687299 RepID=UPI002E7C5537|nr:helix-turn-helix domain-containing protein [Candidatus Vondammii sp. HM_W22]
MSNHIQSKKARHKDWHRADIKAALEKAGWSLRRLATHHGYPPSMAIHALVKPYPNGERLIADAIGMDPWKIWPSRYDENHCHIRKRGTFPVCRPANWAKPERTFQ